ncbi:MAG: DUF3488 and DUF4129 domain-containing transglutaminase family protein [Parahaliea sp.]
MKVSEQVPRNALVWILFSMLLLLLPHIGRMPLWVLAVYIFCACWRVMVYRGQWSFPGRLIKAFLLLICFVSIQFSYHNFLGLEPMVTLLLSAYALKLLELHKKADAYVLIFLSYFICITEFLFSQDLLVVLYLMLNVLLVTSALVALHEGARSRFHWGSMRRAGTMLLQALPLMLVLFFLFPRIGPLWTIPIKSNAARTGVSDFMRPGDISRLGQSDDVAFRVKFEGTIPSRSALYWRGLTFSRLEGGTWSSINYFEIPPAERRPAPVQTLGEPLRYSVLMMPTQQQWLYSLPYAQADQPGILQAPDFRLLSPVEIEDQRRFKILSWPDASLDLQGLSSWRKKAELQLPPAGDPRTRTLAKQMYKDAASDEDYIEAVLRMFNEQSFVYTLQPDLLGDNPMDDFLFTTRRGFCEHYAYAFVMMMRAAGIPARVVAGYQGGEINPLNATVIVHQFDAHAWAEVWLPEKGWYRVDPTAAVAPERIEGGLEQAMAGEGSFLSDSPLSPLRYRSISWVNRLRLQYDALTYRWQSWVVGFDGRAQFDLLQHMLGGFSVQKFLLLIFTVFALVLIPVAVLLLRRPLQEVINPVDVLYLKICDSFARLGVVRKAGEAPTHYADRVAKELPPAALLINRVTQCYVDYRYGNGGSNEAAVQATLRTQLREIITLSRREVSLNKRSKAILPP